MVVSRARQSVNDMYTMLNIDSGRLEMIIDIFNKKSADLKQKLDSDQNELAMEVPIELSINDDLKNTSNSESEESEEEKDAVGDRNVDLAVRMIESHMEDEIQNKTHQIKFDIASIREPLLSRDIHQVFLKAKECQLEFREIESIYDETYETEAVEKIINKRNGRCV